MDVELTRELLAGGRRRDDGRLALRVAAFLIATTRLSRLLVPRRARERAIRSFVWWLFESYLYDSRLAVAYARHEHRLGAPACEGLRAQ